MAPAEVKLLLHFDMTAAAIALIQCLWICEVHILASMLEFVVGCTPSVYLIRQAKMVSCTLTMHLRKFL